MESTKNNINIQSSKTKKTLRFIAWSILHASLITLLVYQTVKIVVYDPLTLSFFAPVDKATDFKMSDIYNAISTQRKVARLDENVVIVDIQQCHSREELADVIYLLDSFNPAVVGLDVYFNHYTSFATDSLITDAIYRCRNMVTPVILINYDQSENDFKDKYISIFQHEYGYKEEGFINLTGNQGNGMIREFTPFLTYRGDTLVSFPIKIASLFQSDSFERLQARGGKAEQINFKDLRFRIISHSHIEEEEENIRGKIVLIGDMNDKNDSYNTPVDPEMSGILLHAYTIATVLGDRYIETQSQSRGVFIAICVCVLFALICYILKELVPDGNDFAIRLIQFVFLLFCLYWGYRSFILSNQYKDFGLLLLMIGFTTLVIDLYRGVLAILKTTFKKVGKIKRINNKV